MRFLYLGNRPSPAPVVSRPRHMHLYILLLLLPLLVPRELTCPSVPLYTLSRQRVLDFLLRVRMPGIGLQDHGRSPQEDCGAQHHPRHLPMHGPRFTSIRNAYPDIKGRQIYCRRLVARRRIARKTAMIAESWVVNVDGESVSASSRKSVLHVANSG